MPKQSERKKIEREKIQASIKTSVREKKPHENYLNHVKELNRYAINSRMHSSRDNAGVENTLNPHSLKAVASLPNLPTKRTPYSEQKLSQGK